MPRQFAIGEFATRCSHAILSRSSTQLEPGSVIRPGNWGRVIRDSGWVHNHSVAPSFGVELIPVGVRDASEVERGVTEFARGLDGGLIVTTGALTLVHRDLIEQEGRFPKETADQ